MEQFGLTEIQAQAILDMRLRALTGLERKRVKDEHADLLERIAELRAILADEARLMALIREELIEIRDQFGDDRRTEIVPAEGEIDLEQLIAEEDMVISITRSGYIKRLALSAYRVQGRGGVGVIGMDTKEDDYIEHLFVASTHDYLLFFTTVGKVYRIKVHELPTGNRQSKGRALVNVLPLRQDEQVRAVIETRDYGEGKYLLFATRKGVVKKTEFKAYDTVLRGRRHHRAQDPRGRRAGRRAPDRRRRRRADGVAQRPGGALLGARRARDGPRRHRRRRHEAARGRRGDRGRDRPRRPGSAGRDRERLRQAHARRGVPDQGPRHDGRADDPLHRGPRPAGRRDDRPRRLRGDADLPRRHRSSAPRSTASRAWAAPRRACG